MDPTDIRYILDDLACNASQEALQELYMLYYKRIARYIGLYVRYDGAVMELTSDVFFAVWENRLELPEIRNFNAYIYRIAKFKALNYLRKRNLPTVNLDEMPLDLFARTSTTPEDDCISAETVRENKPCHRVAAAQMQAGLQTGARGPDVAPRSGRDALYLRQNP